MSVRKVKQRGWVVDIVFTHPDGRKERITRKSPVQTKRGAEAYEREVRASLLNPVQVQREVPTLGSYQTIFMEHAVNNNKYSTQLAKLGILKYHILPTFGRMRLDAINRQKVESYKAKKLRQGYSPKTVNNHLTVLRKTLSLAYEDEIIDRIPPIKWLKVPEQKFDFLDFEEADRLLHAAKQDEMWHVMILLALRSGLRQGELIALRWDDIDMVTGWMRIQRRDWRGNIDTPKSGKTRDVPTTPATLAALKKYRHLRKTVFCQPDGSRLKHGQCKRPLWGFCRLAGLRTIGWHVLRHTYCSHLIMKGVSLSVVQEYAGHSDYRITKRYAHLSPHVGKEAVSVLDEPGHATYTRQGHPEEYNTSETK